MRRPLRASYLAASAALVAVLATVPVGPEAAAIGLPDSFAASEVVRGLDRPTLMSFAPDGRLFVSEQDGRLRVVRDGVLLPEPFLSVTVDSRGEHGLLGVALDPSVAANGYVYVFYTAPSPAPHHRISRFTADGDRAAPGSELVLFELDDLGSEIHHAGGSLAFGPDGKLYASVGVPNKVASDSQKLTNQRGKLLRINPDGTIPTDNPFYETATGKNRAIWVYGLRNPFTFAIQPTSGRMLINDVGQDEWEEINKGAAGSNYGWPETEGPTSDPRFRGPVFAYPHSGPVSGCSIVGAAFYNPPVQQFPPSYSGDYFFADYCGGWIRKLDPEDGDAVTGFATGLESPIDLEVGPDGALYYLLRGGSVGRVGFSGKPAISQQPSDQIVSVGEPATFSVAASGAGPLSYRWQRDGQDIPGASSPTHTIPSAELKDDGATFRCIVSSSLGSATSESATLTVTTSRPPQGTISAPSEGTRYAGGDAIAYSGTGTDAEDGTLPSSAFTWEVNFHHDTHTHPFMAPVAGSTSGSFAIPRTGETSANVWYRIHLTVRDSAGLTHSSFRDLHPRTSTITLATNPAGLQVTLDGQPQTAPYSTLGVVGMSRTVAAVTPQTASGRSYTFRSWSDGGPAAHDIMTAASDATYTAAFDVQGAPPGTVLADATIQRGRRNLGSSTVLQADGKPDRDFLVKLVVSGTSGRKIAGVKLRLFATNGSSSSRGPTFHRARSSEWSESVTWESAPGFESAPIASLGKLRANRWYEVNLASLIKGDGTYSLRASLRSSDGVAFASREAGAARAPQLIVTLSP